MAAESITESRDAWTWEKARHLLFRAGFGGKPTEIEEAVRQGQSAAIEHLLSGPTRPLPVPEWLEDDKKIDPKAVKQLAKEEQQELQRRNRQHLREIQAGWLRFMISAPTPSDMLHEKLAFFWHGHFASSIQKVQATPFIYGQLKLLHEQALGRFGDFLHAIIHDPAMLRYLDNDQNRKGKPNENLARELMELFSLGKGHYTEQDIQEGARALTGWGIEPYGFRQRPFQHDAGEKTIFGKTGKWGGDDFVDLILAQPACARFITGKLWEFFAGENPPAAVIEELAKGFRDSGCDNKALLRALFSHPEFYSAEVMGSQIKSPVQLVVGVSRTLGLAVSPLEFYGQMLLMMGQAPYLPPNVKGWPGGRAWIDTTRLVSRYSFANIIGRGSVPPELDPRMQGDQELNRPEMTVEEKKAARKLRPMMMPRNLRVTFDVNALVGKNATAEEALDRLVRILLPIAPAPEELRSLCDRLKTTAGGALTDEAVRGVVGELMMLPAFQLC